MSDRIIDRQWFIIVISLAWGLILSYLLKKVYIDKRCTIVVVKNNDKV